MSPKNAVSISVQRNPRRQSWVLFCWFGFSWSYSFPAGISLSFGERRERGCVDAAFTLSSSLAAPSPSASGIYGELLLLLDIFYGARSLRGEVGAIQHGLC